LPLHITLIIILTPQVELAKEHGLAYMGGAQRCVFMEAITKKFGFGHHYVVDELNLHLIVGDCIPAAWILAGDPLPLDCVVGDHLCDKLSHLELGTQYLTLADWYCSCQLPHSPYPSQLDV
jgi:hypothetical protein